MAQYIFETDGSYVNFNGGGGLWRLARASNCIAWRFDETGDLFFDVYDQQYIVKAENISDVVIDETPLAAASDFPDAITAVFTGLGGLGGGVESVVAGSGIDVDDTDPANPVVSATGGSSYLVYTAKVTQSGTDAPSATIRENTLSDDPVWSRVDVGRYNITLNGAFTSGKVVAPPFDVESSTPTMLPVYGSLPNSYSYQITWLSANALRLAIYDNTDFSYVEWSAIAEPGVQNLFIEIRVYP